MEEASKDFQVYPIYFDSSVSRADGRKCSKEKGVSKPAFKEIKQALDSLGLKYVGESGKTHPKDLRMQGRFKVGNAQSKRSLMADIAVKLKDIRSGVGAKQKDNANPLNLVARSKKKSKK